MSEKEHPAALAGRYLRAAGVAIQKELERRAVESEQEKTAEAKAEATAPPAAQPQAQAQAAPPADTKQSAAAARRAARQRPPVEPRPIVDRVIWLVFMVALLALALSGLQIQVLASGSTQTVIRLVLGIPLVVAALLVLTNWGRSNERIVARVFKMWGLDQPTTKSGRLARRFGKDALTLLGIVLLAIAAFQLMSAVVN